jgi:hypothetical protein
VAADERGSRSLGTVQCPPRVEAGSTPGEQMFSASPPDSASAKQARRESGGNPVSRSSVYEHFLLFRKRSGTISEGAQLVGGTDEGPLP